MKAVLVLGVLGLLVAAAERGSRRRFRRLGRPVRGMHRLLPDLALLVALALLFFSEAPDRRTPPGDGPSLVLAVDVSASMAAVDSPPSRIVRAREKIRTLVAALPEARFALLPFAGSAVTQVPFTEDREALLFFVDRLAAGTVAAPGSAPEEAVAAAAELLAGVPGEKGIILFTDGERTIAEPPPEVPTAIPVFAVPLGTVTGAPVVDGRGQPRRDGAGRPIFTRLVPDTLRRLADRTGGRLLEEDRESAVQDLIERWQPSRPAGPAPLPLATAIALLLLRQLSGLRIGRRRSGALSLVLSLLVALVACRAESDPSGRELFSRGLRVEAQDPSAAAALFARAARRLEGPRRAAALYNQGSLLLSTGSAAAAIPLLEEALLLMPGDEATRINLALALRAGGPPQAPGIGTGAHGEGDGEDGRGLSRAQAVQLVEQIRPEPLAPPAEPATIVRDTVPGRDW